MSQHFVFHDVRTTDLPASRRFYGEMFGWPVTESPAGPMFGDDDGVWGGFTPLVEGDDRRPQWIPYVPVADVDAAAERAVTLGARIVKPRTDLPPGSVVVVDEPGGATLALWQAARPA
ncbi:VOC family protein [Nocardia sp. BMG51109]|uniref:VOC family protein n=1 Tax=Nocardia sp. BMG51109 TaxID=1056816 RepID=UPI000463B22D|nr:VOC family protein [Nocardia sp. BMG51109]